MNIFERVKNIIFSYFVLFVISKYTSDSKELLKEGKNIKKIIIIIIIMFSVSKIIKGRIFFIKIIKKSRKINTIKMVKNLYISKLFYIFVKKKKMRKMNLKKYY